MLKSSSKRSSKLFSRQKTRSSKLLFAIEHLERRDLLTALTPGVTIHAGLTVTNPSENYTFSASAGNCFEVKLGDFPGSAVRPELTLFGPDGTQLQESDSFTSTNTSVKVFYQVPSNGTGTYKVVVQDTGVNGSKFGDYYVELALANGQSAATDSDNDSGTLTSGVTKNGSINRLGNIDIYTFSASVGNSFEVKLGDATGSAVRPQLILFDPNGTQLQESDSFTSTNTSVKVFYQVPSNAAGTYTVWVLDDNISGGQIGGYSVELALANGQSATTDSDNDSGTLTSGVTKNGSINRLGNIDIYTFSASANNSFEVKLGDATGSAVRPQLILFDPNGTLLLESDSSTSINTSVRVFYPVPPNAAGTYTVWVLDDNINGGQIGGYSVELALANGQSAAIDSDNDSGTLTSGVTKNGSINRLGNIDIYTFSASANNSFEVKLGDATGSAVRPQLILFDPNGTLLLESDSSTSINTSVRVFYPVPPNAAGTYTVWVLDDNINGGQIGGYSVELALANGQSAAIDSDNDSGTLTSGVTKNGSINRLGNIDIYTFSASANNSFEVKLGDATGSAVRPQLILFDPNGTLLLESDSSTSTNTSVDVFYPVPPNAAGTYTVWVLDDNINGGQIGGYSVELALANGQSAATDSDNDSGTLTSGVTKNGSINRLGNIDIYTFNETAGTNFKVTLADVTGSGMRPELTLFGPTGAEIQNTNSAFSTNTSVNESYIVPSNGAGTYTIWRKTTTTVAVRSAHTL